jgi:hypothetical protein
MLGPKKEAVTGGSLKQHSEEQHYTHSSPRIEVDQIKFKEMGGTCVTYGGKEKCIQRFGWKS